MEHRNSWYIGGRWVEPSTTDTIDVIGTSTEEIIGRVPHAAEADIDRAVAAARTAMDAGPWPSTTPEERGDLVGRLSQEVAARDDTLAHTITAGIALETAAPFGGVKQSGLGRELGPEGLAAYHELKSIMQVPPAG